MSKLTVRRALAEVEENRWQCETCTAPTESDDAKYCMSCRLYWGDVRNGLFDEHSFPLSQESNNER